MPDVQPPPAQSEAAPPVDLEAQLDSLLARISEQTLSAENAAKAKLAAAGSPAGQTQSDAVAPVSADAMAATEPQTTQDAAVQVKSAESDDDLAGNALAQQIQELLDDAKSAEGRKNAAAPKVATGAVQPTSPVEAVRPMPPDPKKVQAVKAVVQQLDAELAAGAEDAVADKFEVPQSPAAAKPDNLLTSAAALSTDAHSDDQHGVAEHDHEQTRDDAANENMQDHPGDLSAEADHLDVSEESAHSSHADSSIGHTPGGQAVARELDEQPEKPRSRPRPSSQPTENKAQPKQPPAFRTRIIGLVLGMPTFKRCMAMINQPLMHVSGETRNIIGYVGLVTILNGATLVGLRVMLGPPKPRERPPAAQVVESSSESGEGGGHGSAKKDTHADKRPAPAKKPAKAESSGEE